MLMPQRVSACGFEEDGEVSASSKTLLDSAPGSKFAVPNGGIDSKSCIAYDAVQYWMAGLKGMLRSLVPSPSEEWEASDGGGRHG